MRRSASIALFALALSGCPRPGGNTRPDGTEVGHPQYTAKRDTAADEALAAAIQVADTQPKPKGIEAFTQVIKSYPETTAAQDAMYRLGVLYFEQGDFANARREFNELLFENPLYEKAEDAKLKSGLSSLEVHAYRDAYQTLSALADKATGEERTKILDAAGRAAEGAGLYGESLRIAIKLGDEAKTDAEKQEATQRIGDLVEGKVPFIDVARVRQDLPATHPAWPLLTFKLARIYYHLRDWQHLKETLNELLREAPNTPYTPEAKTLLERAEQGSIAKPKVIGLVAPMTGKFKQWGEAVKRGLDLALKGSDVEVIVKDTQGDVNLAGKEVEELALDDGAIAIIGPLSVDESRRAALVAEELGVPILTLTKNESITAIGPHVFRNMLTNNQQAEALADYAVNTLGYKTFATLYPNIPFGVEMMNDFWDDVAARGGKMQGAEVYDYDQTTFSHEVKKLVGREYLLERADYLEKFREVKASDLDEYHKRKALEKVQSQLDPVIDFEALLIPDSWQHVGLVAPALAAEDIITNACDQYDIEKIKKTTKKTQLKTVTLLGTNTWSSPKDKQGVPELLNRGGKFVLCSVYVDGFFADSARPATKRFVGQFEDAYKDVQPTLLDAIGYDSAAMVRQIVEKDRPQNREDFTLRLATMKNFDGATGTTSFNDKREAQKPLFFLSIDKKGVKEVTPKGGGKPPAG